MLLDPSRTRSGPVKQPEVIPLTSAGQLQNDDSENGAVPVLTIVVAVLNEEQNIPVVCQELLDVLPSLPATEIIFVDDGSTDQTVKELVRFRQATKISCFRILSHDRRCGKSSALRTGIRAAHGQWVATIDGDGQDNPQEISALFHAATKSVGRAPLVVGVRLKRQDTIWRRLATKFANGLRQKLLNDGCPDTGAPMKVFLRKDFLSLPYFEGLHRFIPALMQSYGVPLVCQPVVHRTRLHGESKYTNFGRAIVGIRDLLGVMWLRNRTHIPLSVREC